MLLRFGLLFHFVAFCCGLLQAQDTAVQDSSIYKGLRISIFGIEVLKQKPEHISLRLQVANTGRLPVSFGKKKQRAPESLVIEIDTVNLPVILRGREQQLTNAVRTQKIKLAPGDILDELKLDVAAPTIAPSPSKATAGGATYFNNIGSTCDGCC